MKNLYEQLKILLKILNFKLYRGGGVRRAFFISVVRDRSQTKGGKQTCVITVKQKAEQKNHPHSLTPYLFVTQITKKLAFANATFRTVRKILQFAFAIQQNIPATPERRAHGLCRQQGYVISIAVNMIRWRGSDAKSVLQHGRKVVTEEIRCDCSHPCSVFAVTTYRDIFWCCNLLKIGYAA